MSAFNHAYQSLSSTGQKVVKKPRLFLPVVLVIIALLGAISLWISEYGRNFDYGDLPLAYGSYRFDESGAVPPTRDLHMTEEQCTTAFPLLYQEADRAQEYYREKGGIRKRDVDAAEEEGNARVVISNNTVSIHVLDKSRQLTNVAPHRCTSRHFEEE